MSLDAADYAEIEELRLAAARTYCTIEQRPWGVLLHNAANPDHYSANMARDIRAADPEAVIDEIVAFYHGIDQTPRAYIDAQTQPPHMLELLQARGFEARPDDNRLMRWDGVPAEPPPVAGLEIALAGPDDLETVTAITGEANGDGDVAWIRGHLVQQLADPAVRYYLARLDGVPAAIAAVVLGPRSGMVDNVATLPAYQRRGLAAAVLARAQADASGPLLLEVVEPHAERLYARLGFRLLGTLRQTSVHLPR